MKILPVNACIDLVLAAMSEEKFQCRGLQSRYKALHFPTCLAIYV